jgi:hypothetical protein
MREFLKQAGVLNRDDSLVGKGLKQGHVLLRERPDIGVPNCNCANRIVTP